MINSKRVLIIGGYGEFGGRLAQLLVRDGHDVIVAGRNLDKAQRFCQRHACKALQLDINNDLSSLATIKVDVIVDAAGPYQAYGQNDERYRVAKAALECGAHYLDLSDDGNFSAGLTVLDGFAKSKNLVALSGASTTPAISGAVISNMKLGVKTIDKIETSILPGCRAPQGHAVMRAILDQVGNPIQFWRNKQWTAHTGWSNPVKKRIGHTIARDANLIMAADALLFPDHFKAKSVLFRAGLEVSIMNRSLYWLSLLRSRSLLPNLVKFITPLRWLADRITPFGRDTGGMLVELIGQRETDSEQLVHKRWQLRAEPAQGPFVPAVPARALIRKIDNMTSGARVCISELSLQYYADAMSDLGLTTELNENAFEYLFQQSLGTDWHALPSAIQATHKVIDQRVLTGTAKITRGTSPLTQLAAAVFRFPPAAEEIPVKVTKTREGEHEIWVRDFNAKQFKSTLRLTHDSSMKDPMRTDRHTDVHIIEEQFGLLKFKLRLRLEHNAMHFDVVRGSCLGLPIPRLLLPISNTREFVKDDTMHFYVELLAPFNLGLIVRYEGWLK